MGPDTADQSGLDQTQSGPAIPYNGTDQGRPVAADQAGEDKTEPAPPADGLDLLGPGTTDHGGLSQLGQAWPERRALDYLGPAKADQAGPAEARTAESRQVKSISVNITEKTDGAEENHAEDADERLVRALEADGRQVDSEVSAFEHMADKMATFARDLASRAAATAGRLSHQHELLLSSIANSSTVQEAHRRARTAHQAAAAARRAAANETERLQDLRQQGRRVAAALKAAETAVRQWRRLEAESHRSVRRLEQQLVTEQARTREVALPSRAAGQERAEERRRLQAAVQRLETLLRKQTDITGRLRRRAGAAARRAAQATRLTALLAERRRRLPLQQAAARRSYTELNELRLAAARRRAHQALLRADASVGNEQELLGRAAAAATQPPRQRMRPPLPVPPPAPDVLRLRVEVPEKQQHEQTTQPALLL